MEYGLILPTMSTEATAEGIAVGKVRPERLLEHPRRSLVHELGLADELVELRPDDVDVDGRPNVLARSGRSAGRAR